jgi:hypothetical protein
MPVDNKIKTAQTYEIPPEQAIIITEYLMRVWNKLGKPSDPLTRTGQAMVDAIILAYQKTYPKEWHDWLENRKEYQSEELTVHQQINTGRSLASYPVFIYYLMKKIFPNVDLTERKFVLKLIKIFPAFRVTGQV